MNRLNMFTKSPRPRKTDKVERPIWFVHIQRGLLDATVSGPLGFFVVCVDELFRPCPCTLLLPCLPLKPSRPPIETLHGAMQSLDATSAEESVDELLEREHLIIPVLPNIKTTAPITKESANPDQL